jgi:hypothetical protein
MIVWGGSDGVTCLGSGARYNPATDTWDPTSGVDAPAGRYGHSAVWTGTDMIVWGGAAGDTYFNSGGRYDAKANHWTPTSIIGAPSARSLHSAVWTGSEMIVWGGYSNIGVEAWYRTGGRYQPDGVFDAPTADAGPDRVVECAGVNGTVVRLHGSGTGCDSLTFTWTGPFVEGQGVMQGSDVDVTLPLGQSTIALRVGDTHGQSATATVQIAVRDTTPPSLSVLADPASLWPADHRLVPVRIARQVRDLCDPNPAVTIVAVTSSEPDDAPGKGDGNTTGDISGADPGTAGGEVELRAERDGAGPGRIYRLTYQAIDASGNSTPAFTVVTVPHDQRSGPAPLSVLPGSGRTPGMVGSDRARRTPHPGTPISPSR